MARLPIPYGDFVNDPDPANSLPIRTAWQRTDDNFTDLYALQSQTVNAGDVRFQVGATTEARIQLAIDQAVVELAGRVYVPASMTPYDVSLLTLSDSVQMVWEGGDYGSFDAKAYGATGDGIADDTASVRAVVDSTAGANTNGGPLVFPPGDYFVTGNPFKNRVGTGNVPLSVYLNGAKWVTTKQIKLPTSTVVRGTNRLRCGVSADSTFIGKVAITSIVRTSNVVTVTTGSVHSLESNATVIVDGVTDTSFNGIWHVTSTPTTSSYTFAQTASDTSDTTGSTYIPLVVMGDHGLSSHGVRMENLLIEGNSVADCVAMASNSINELSGMSAVLFNRVTYRAIWIDRAGQTGTSGGPLNYRFDDLEINMVDGADAGIYARSSYGMTRGFRHITVNSNDALGVIRAGMDVSGVPGHYDQLHFERCTDGLLVGNRGSSGTATDASAGMIITNVTGHETVPTLVRLKNYGEVHDIVLQGLVRLLATSTLVDEVNSITLTDNYVGFYAISSTGARFSTVPTVSWKAPAGLAVTGTLTNTNGPVIIDATTAKITLDGTDGTIAAGSNGVAENGGGLNLSARSSINVLIDNDNNSTTQGFAVYKDVTSAGGTPLLQVTEAGVMFGSGELRIAGDIGGAAATNALTGVSDVTANSSGVGTILFKGTTNRNSTGFIKIYIGTTAYYVPVFAAITG